MKFAKVRWKKSDKPSGGVRKMNGNQTHSKIKEIAPDGPKRE